MYVDAHHIIIFVLWLSGFYNSWCIDITISICSGSSVLLTSFRGKEDGLNYIAAGGILYLYRSSKFYVM